MGSIHGAARTRPPTLLIAVHKTANLTSTMCRRKLLQFRSQHLHRALQLYRIPRRQKPPRYLQLFTPSCKSSLSASVSASLSVPPSAPASFFSRENITERAEGPKLVTPTVMLISRRGLGDRRPDQWRCLIIDGLLKCRGTKSMSCTGRNKCGWRYPDEEEAAHKSCHEWIPQSTVVMISRS